MFRESSSYILVSSGILQTNDPTMDLQHHSACRQIKLMKRCEFSWMREDVVKRKTYTGKSGSVLVSMQGSKLRAWEKKSFINLYSTFFLSFFSFFTFLMYWWKVAIFFLFPHGNRIVQHQKWKGKRIRRITRLTPCISTRCFPFSQLHPTLPGQNLQKEEHIC